MKKILTLEEWSPLKFNGELKYNKTDMIEFAKLHVEAALKEASEKAFAQSSHSNFTSKDRQLYGKQGLICVHLGEVSVNEESILNSYPLSNIK